MSKLTNFVPSWAIMKTSNGYPKASKMYKKFIEAEGKIFNYLLRGVDENTLEIKSVEIVAIHQAEPQSFLDITMANGSKAKIATTSLCLTRRGWQPILQIIQHSLPIAIISTPTECIASDETEEQSPKDKIRQYQQTPRGTFVEISSHTASYPCAGYRFDVIEDNFAVGSVIIKA